MKVPENFQTQMQLAAIISERDKSLLGHGMPLWVNVRALADGKQIPYAYLEKQNDDDVCILISADKRTIEGKIVQKLHDLLKARNQEIQTLRKLYLDVSIACEKLGVKE